MNNRVIMNSESRVTIAIPVLNMEATLAATVESALNQRYENLEVIIVNNGSSDRSAQIAESYAASDRRCRVVHRSHTVSMAENYNSCIEQSSGQFINILSADDILDPDFITACMAMFALDDSLGYVATSHSLIDEAGNIAQRPPFYDSSAIIRGTEETLVNLKGNHSAPSYMLYRKTALAMCGGFTTQYPYTFDIDTKLKISMAWNVGYVARALCLYRLELERGPSLFRGSDFSPLFELYRIKQVFARQLTGVDASIEAAVNRNIAKVAVSLAKHCRSLNQENLASRYEALAMAFQPLPQDLPPTQNPVSPVSAAGSYPVPAGSKVVDVEGLQPLVVDL